LIFLLEYQDIKNKKMRKKIKNMNWLQQFGHKIHIVVTSFAIFGVLVFILGIVGNQQNWFKADVFMKETDSTAVCNFTTTYIRNGTWKDHLNLPALIGPEDAYGILGIETVCSEDDGCREPVCELNDQYCVDGYINRLSIAKTADKLPYSVNEIELSLLATSEESEAIVTFGGQVDGRKGVITNGRFSGTQMTPGAVVTDFNAATANLALYIKNTNQDPEDFVGADKKCAIAVFTFHTSYSSEIKGKITGTKAGEENGIANAKVILEPCPRDDRGTGSEEAIRTVPFDQGCEVVTDRNGNYLFPDVLPRRATYSVQATRQ
jgi:hypothetical protein